MSHAALIKRMNAQTIAREGSDVVVSPSLTLKALKTDDQVRIARFQQTDGLQPSNKTPVLFRFAGSVWDAHQVGHGATLTCEGVGYRVAPDGLHPQMNGGLCVELAVVAYKP